MKKSFGADLHVDVIVKDHDGEASEIGIDLDCDGVDALVNHTYDPVELEHFNRGKVMRDDVVVASTPMSDFFRNSTPEQKRAAYALAAGKAIESQKRTIESAKTMKKSQK